MRQLVSSLNPSSRLQCNSCALCLFVVPGRLHGSNVRRPPGQVDACVTRPGWQCLAELEPPPPSHNMIWSCRTLADTDAAHALPIPTTLSHLPHHTTACRAVHRHSTRGPTDHSASATTSLRRQAHSPATEHTIPALYPSPVLDHRKWMMAAEATDTNPVDVPPTEPSSVSRNTSRVRRRVLATAHFPSDATQAYSTAPSPSCHLHMRAIL